MVATEIVCTECGTPSPKGGFAVDEEGDVPGVELRYCASGGAGPNPWEEREKYDFKRDVDLPVVFSYHVYDDDYGLWHAFTQEAFGTELRGSAIANLPELPSMGFLEAELFFKLTEERKLKGPFLDEETASRA